MDIFTKNVAALKSAAISMSLIAAVVLLAFYLEEYFSHAVEVSTPNGVIIGANTRRSREGKVIFSFTGIPYAEPPVGELRFKESQPAKPWETPFDATKPCPICPFTLPRGEFRTFGQEDCLYLNVYTPSLDPEDKLPVMVFTHGGAFMSGQTQAEPDFLLEDIVLMDMTYRLGPLGFATTGDGIIRENLGLKDIVLALKWVKENIEYFGGDPNLVTVFGHSAGAISAHLLLLSPLSKGLIHRGISMSGTAECPWGLLPQQVAVDRTKALSVLCGCPLEPSEKLLECMQTVPIRDLLNMEKNLFDELCLPLAPFAPVIEASINDNAFLTEHPSKIESDIPWMTGIASFEGLAFPNNFQKVVDKNGLNLEEYFYSKLPKLLLLDLQFTKSEIPSVVNKTKEFYVGDGPISMENIPGIDDMVADSLFLTGVVKAVPKHEGKTYLYLYEYVQESNVSFAHKSGPGLQKKARAAHGDDLLSIFPLSMNFANRADMTATDLEVSKKMTHLWTTFAKYGNLDQNTVTPWEPVDKETSQNKYLHISPTGEFQQKEDLLKERANFWRSLEES